MIKVYSQISAGQRWLQRYRGCQPLFACILGFTETGLIPGISTAGATPEDRRSTALADAEFLYHGPRPQPTYPLPPLDVGVSPVFISRAVVQGQQLPLQLFNAGLSQPPTVPAIDLGGIAACCLSQGQALPRPQVEHLLNQGLVWGEQLAAQVPRSYLMLGECVVGGTTTALAVLLGLGVAAAGKVNSSHPTCNHAQKWTLVQQGLERAGWPQEPLDLVAAVGDPMQIVVAGMTIAASRSCGVLLAGGTQMLAVYALARAIAHHYGYSWQPEPIVVGTTRWVAEDPTADTIGLADMIGDVPLLASQLSFAQATYSQLQAYERGYVKEGMGAGGCAIAANLYQSWGQDRLLTEIEQLVQQYDQTK